MNSEQILSTAVDCDEDKKRMTPDLLHCEALRFRSRKQPFKVGPHRHRGLNQIFYLQEGSGVVHLNGEAVSVKAPCIITIPDECVHHFDWADNVEGRVVSITTSLINQLTNSVNLNKSAICSTNITPVHQNKNGLERIFELLFEEYNQLTAQNRNHALNSILHLLGIWLERNAQVEKNSASRPSKSADIFERFNQLINNDYHQNRKLQDYASELGITEPHLNKLCQQLANKNAQQIVHDRIILEAKRNLIYTISSVSQIANDLGFNDPPYFSRFFKRITGTTPKEFRQRHAADINNIYSLPHTSPDTAQADH